MTARSRGALGRDDLVLSAGTVRHATFEQRVRAAAAGGFAAIGLRPQHYAAARDAGLTDADMRDVLDEHDVRVAELEVLWNWAFDDERGQAAREWEERLYEVADALGGRHLIANSEVEDPIDVVAGRFAGLCDRAAEHELLVAIEFLPWTTIPDAATAWEIAHAADRDNGGVLVDTWHHYRGAADDDMIRAIPAERILALHFNDADAEPVGDLYHDTVHNRRLPGEGDFDLPRFVRLIDDMGVSSPLSVEVLSDDLVAMDPLDAAVEAGTATRRVLEDVRGA